MISVFEALALGIIQGITDWIPVSSKTQVLITGNIFFGTPVEELLGFALILHIGSLLAAIILFRQEISSFIRKPLNPRDLNNFNRLPEAKLLQAFVFFAMVATVFVALPLYLLVRKNLTTLHGSYLLATVGVLLIVTGIIFLNRPRKTRQNKDLDVKHALFTGFCQGVSVLPGVSRSGTTEFALLASHFDQTLAIRLSFMLSIPMDAAALIGFSLVEGVPQVPLGVAAVGIATAAIVALAMMKTMLALTERVNFSAVSIAIGIIALLPLALQYAGF